MKWTEDQEKSIFAKPAQIVVSAAAGSGKTQVLTTRIIERIKSTTDPVSVEKLLVVTFTKAAASEMKERIGKALRKAANETTINEERKYLKSQLSLLGSAHICTIDSFCYDIVKQNFYKVNLPSDISIGETGELSLLKLSSLEETVNSLYCALEKKKGNFLTEENEQLAAIAEKYFPEKEELDFILDGFELLSASYSYDKRDSEFSENIKGAGDYTTMISELYKKAQSAAYPEKWLREVAEAYNCKKLPFENTFVCRYIVTTCKQVLKNASKSISDLAEIACTNNIGNDEFLRNEAETLLEFSQCENYAELYNFYQKTPLFTTLKGKNTDCDKALKSSITEARATIRKYVRDNILKNLLSFSIEEWESLRTQQYPQIKALCFAAILLGRIYYDKMTSRKILDFPSCEHLALEIISEDSLTLTDAGESLKQKYDEIYIDEFQDSNELQDMLFSLLSKGRSFMVGDVKQSIYGFRNSDPSIFMNKCDESSFDVDSEKKKNFSFQKFQKF